MGSNSFRAGGCSARGFLVFVLGLFAATSVFAQRASPPGTFGIGAQVGQPTGITFKGYIEPDLALDALVAWRFDRSVFLNVHASYEYIIPDSPLGFYTGPGLLAGVHWTMEDTSWRLALTAICGLNYFTHRFEVFLQTRPNLDLIPRTRLGIGGAVGIRYYF